MIAATKAASHGFSSYIIFIYVLVIGAFYYFYLRPRNMKQKAARLDARKVEVGERAQTIGGFVGTVVKSGSDFITLRTESGVELDFVPSAIARRFDPVVHESTDDEAGTQEGDK
jgi:preprotein translocase subunit YajC